MTTAEKREMVRRLRRQGRSVAEIARECGLSQGYVSKLARFDGTPYPAWERRNRERRNAQKRRSKLNGRVPCPRCGGLKSREAGLCAACYRASEESRVALRGHRIERWWRGGLSMREIAGRLGWTKGHLSAELDMLRREGFDLPLRYCRGRERTQRVRAIAEARRRGEKNRQIGERFGLVTKSVDPYIAEARREGLL